MTLRHVSREYFWPGMAADIGKFVRKCHMCQNGESVLLEARPMLTPPTALARVAVSGQYTGYVKDQG